MAYFATAHLQAGTRPISGDSGMYQLVSILRSSTTESVVSLKALMAKKTAEPLSMLDHK